MPVYSYQCPKCRQSFDQTMPVVDRDKAKCPSCRVKAKRKISVPGVQFNGPGFYKTDK